MQHGIHFISGLPRSGSTLLAALLLQNPAVHAGITSPVASLVGAVLRDLSQANETSIFVDNTQREVLLRGLFDGYYHDIHPRKVVFDTNRAWTSRIDLVMELFPDSKIICCVRHIPWIIDSTERLIRRNNFELSKIFSFETDGTVYSRADGMMRDNGFIGFPLNSFKQAMHSAYSKNVLLLPYDLLAAHPQATLDAVYAFTGLPAFKHDVDNVVFDTREFDARLGTPGLHDVRRQARPEARESILPPDLWKKYESASIWRDPAFNSRGVSILAPEHT